MMTLIRGLSLDGLVITAVAFGISLITSLVVFAAHERSRYGHGVSETALLLVWLLGAGFLVGQGALVLCLIRRDWNATRTMSTPPPPAERES